MTKIAVPDMMCENCVKRITNALTEADLQFSVSLEEKTVTIDGCENCVKTAVRDVYKRQGIGIIYDRREEVHSLDHRQLVANLVDTGIIAAVIPH